MLNGIDPIIIFGFSKIVTATTDANGNPITNANKAKIPVADSILSKLPLPFIPIYLSEALTGIYIETEDKSIEIDTSTETTAIADKPYLNQRGINNTIKVNMTASKDSVGMILLSALADYIFPRVTSREYSISYFHGATTIIDGLLHSFSINQTSQNDLFSVSMELVKIGIIPKQPITEIPNVKDVVLKNGSPVK